MSKLAEKPDSVERCDGCTQYRSCGYFKGMWLCRKRCYRLRHSYNKLRKYQEMKEASRGDE